MFFLHLGTETKVLRLRYINIYIIITTVHKQINSKRSPNRHFNRVNICLCI